MDIARLVGEMEARGISLGPACPKVESAVRKGRLLRPLMPAPRVVPRLPLAEKLDFLSTQMKHDQREEEMPKPPRRKPLPPKPVEVPKDPWNGLLSKL